MVNSKKASQDARCICGTALPREFLSLLQTDPGSTRPCINNDCRVVHQFVQPDKVPSEFAGFYQERRSLV